MSSPQTGVTHYHAQLGLPDKGRAFKGLVVGNSWNLEPLVLINSPRLAQLGTIQLGLSDKGRAFKGLVICNSKDVGPAKRTYPKLLSIVP